jgi:hypothetical protein
MSFYDRLRSFLNSFLWWLRRSLRFRRPGYTESLAEPPRFSDEAARLNSHYQMDAVSKRLSAFNGARNLSTLWYLEQMFGDRLWPKELTLLEPGCQEFVRLPAWRQYFKTGNVRAKIIGIEVDPFPILHDLHSRWDRAQYYISLEDDAAEYVGADFFNWDGGKATSRRGGSPDSSQHSEKVTSLTRESRGFTATGDNQINSDNSYHVENYHSQAQAIFCFYPFVSVEPALAWGLPAHFASAEKWIESFQRNLEVGGTLLLVHQGEWEEKDFDRAREKLHSTLQLTERKILECPFFKTAHPMCASVYIKKGPR